MQASIDERGIKITQDVIKISEEEWVFAGGSGDDIIKVESGGNCGDYISCLKCPICNICRHTLICNCKSYRLGQICKHTHAVMLTNALPLPEVTADDTRQEIMKRHSLRPAMKRNAEDQIEVLLEIEESMDSDDLISYVAEDEDNIRMELSDEEEETAQELAKFMEELKRHPLKVQNIALNNQ